MGLTVGEVSALVGVSVRTLHHYDKIGLLAPSERSDAGYRLYGDGDLATMQQILFFKELGFTLQNIRGMMHDPSFERLEALHLQRRMLVDKSAQLQKMIQAVDKAIDSGEKGTEMDKSEMFEVFGDYDPSQYEEEVQKKWGTTDAYTESARRTSRYKKGDWKEVKRKGDELNERMAKLLDAGVAATDAQAMDVAEEARLMIDRWFYPCSHPMHAGLAELYVADDRFMATYEKVRAGLAQYTHDAIKANAERHAGRNAE